MSYDLIIKNGTILTVNDNYDIVPQGWIGINKGIITAIESQALRTDIPDACKTIDAKNGIIMPGLINTHTHLPMSLFRGLADDLPLMVWLNEHIFPAEASHINPESVYAGALLSCAEMIMSGTTTCCGGYFLENEVAKAVQKSGLRAILGQGVIDFPAPGIPDPAHNVEHAAQYADSWTKQNACISPSIFCHSPYTCSRQTLQRAKHEADKRSILFQIHIAETKTEWDNIAQQHQATPIQYLNQIGILDQNTLLVHSIWVDSTDIEIIARTKAKISVTTESEMKLASGIAPVPEFLNAGIDVGLGTDGCASNNNLDMFGEMDMTAKLHKVNKADPTILDARTVLKLGTINAARAIGLGDITGSLEIGKQADIITIDTNQPHLTPLYRPTSHLVYAAKGSDVCNVLVAGKILMQDKKPVTLELESVLENINPLIKRIQSTCKPAN